MLLEMKYRMEREAGREEGREEGREKGREEYRSCLAKLTDALVADNRLEDVQRAIRDEACFESLCREYGITRDDPALR